MEMKAISIRQPYASQIISGKKRFEYRSWRTHFRGKLMVCSTVLPKLDGLKSGMALGTVEVIDCRPRKAGGFAWGLENPRPLARPFRVKGKLGFYDIRHPSK
ncbi:MAG: hypothetical protein A2W25_00330 [candidate division Zixibacteria bacterium RBG_16_53_22]|nr:MAG: hypothetical protein A2W25_00330 [candidate division Zixibacteria bacterium RBG_16_53_22]